MFEFKNAIKYGKQYWDSAIKKYNNGDKEGAYWDLGIVVHLLQDMSSVPHVYLDWHIVGEEITKGYEQWVFDNRGRTELFVDLQIQQPSQLTYDQFLHEVAQKTYDAVKMESWCQA